MVDNRNKTLDKAVDLIHQNKFTCITGNTGSGKSSLVPARYAVRYPNSSVLVIQPRRLPCYNLAQYVAEQNGWEVGKEVGILFGALNNSSALSRITFGTAGSILSKVCNDPNLPFDIVFFDEAHEHQVDQELTLAIFRLICFLDKTKRCVIMSATIEAQIFKKYLPGLQYYNIPSICNNDYTITEYDWSELGKYSVNENLIESLKTAKKRDQYDKCTLEIAEQLLKDSLIAVQLAVKEVVEEKIGESGQILVFLPSFDVISRVSSLLNATNLDLDIQMLHSRFSEEYVQETVFSKSPQGYRKVILTTSIAETSLTFPEATVVIDTGLSRSRFYDSSLGVFQMMNSLASQNSMTQRRGRVGRVTSGTYICLLPPEIKALVTKEILSPLKVSTAVEAQFLSRHILKLADSQYLSVSEIISSLINSPAANLFNNAVESLKKQSLITADFRQTLKGSIVSKSPVDTTAALATMYALSGMTRLGIILAASANENPSDVGSDIQMPSYHKISEINRMLAVLNWKKEFPSNIYGPTQEELDYCTNNGLSYSALRKIELNCYTFFDRYYSYGFCQAPNLFEKGLLKRQNVSFQSICEPEKNYVSSLISAEIEMKHFDNFVRLYPLFKMISNPELVFVPTIRAKPRKNLQTVNYSLKCPAEAVTNKAEEFPELKINLFSSQKGFSLSYRTEDFDRASKFITSLPKDKVFRSNNQVLKVSLMNLEKASESRFKFYTRKHPIVNSSSIMLFEKIATTRPDGFILNQIISYEQATFMTPLLITALALVNNGLMYAKIGETLFLKIDNYAKGKKRVEKIFTVEDKMYASRLFKMIQKISEAYDMFTSIFCEIESPAEITTDPRACFREALLEALDLSQSQKSLPLFSEIDSKFVEELVEGITPERRIKWTQFAELAPCETQ